MRSLIAIAVGAYILLSGNEIGVLVNVSYISLITNLVGVLLIVWGVKGLVEYNAAEMRKREQHYDTIKSMLEKISLDSQTRDIQKQLTQIYDEQLNYMQISKNMMAVFGRIETVIRRTDESVFQIHQTNISQIEFLKKITQDIKSLEETNTKDIEAVKLALKNMNHDLHMDYVEFKSRIEELERGKIMELKYFREMPAHIMELEISFIDKIENKFTAAMDSMNESIGTIRCDNQSNINDIGDRFEDLTEDLKSNMNTLIEEYNQFKDFASSLVKQMTAMTENDLKVMEGFLNE